MKTTFSWGGGGGGADVTVGPGNPGRPVFPGGEWR